MIIIIQFEAQATLQHWITPFVSLGMQPVLYSSISKTWERIGTHITYYRNNYQRTNHTREKEEDDGAEGGGGGGGGGRRKTGGNSINKRYFTATFTLSFPSSEDVCYLSYHYPYTYSMLKVKRQS